VRSGGAFYRKQAAFAWSPSAKGVWLREAAPYDGTGSACRAGRARSGANGDAACGEHEPQDASLRARPRGARPREGAYAREGTDPVAEGGEPPRGMAHALGRARCSGRRDVVAQHRTYFN
jgi:hypothetical protein